MTQLSAKDVTFEELNYVRSKFLESAANENESLYDEVDIERVRTHDWTVQRHILDRDHNLDDAVAMLKDTMKWRKENDVNNIKESDFPAEFFGTSELFVYEQDNDGHTVGYVRSCLHKKFSEWQKLEERFVLFFFETIEKRARERNTAGDERWIFVWDCDSSTLFNTNIDLIRHFISTLLYRYPIGVYWIYVHQLPFICWALYQLAKGMCPERYVHILIFTDKKSIVEKIGSENLPDYFEGGKCIKKYRGPPSGNSVPSIAEVAEKHNIDKKAIDRFINHYKKYLDV